NVWYDTAGSPLLFPTAAIFRTALTCVDHRKLLYASDYPLLLYPRRQNEPDFRPFIAEIDALGLAAEVYEDIMGNNAARLLGLLPTAEVAPLPPRRPGRQAVITEIEPQAGMTIGPLMAVSAVAQAWPATQAVFERYGIPWRDSPVPDWEPIAQAAAARGLGPTARQRLLDELNAAI
ncbi:MAG: amidohydrolase family protein, partial [Anaerolineae bacterium]|nr:amidohydrolase family protein [Anaerolineae bacterium]